MQLKISKSIALELFKFLLLYLYIFEFVYTQKPVVSVELIG